MNHASTPEGLASAALFYYADDHPLHETALAGKGSLLSMLEELCRRARIQDPRRAGAQLLLVAEGSFALRRLIGADESTQLGIIAANHLLSSFPKDGGPAK